MTHYAKHEVAISDADRAEIEAIFIDLMRERAAAQGGAGTTPSPIESPEHPGSH
jgi:hypothetical protein